MGKVFNVTLDGPGGSGKTSIAKAVAERLNIAYLDTGAMYRGVAYYMLTHGIDVADEKAVLEVLDKVDLKVTKTESGEQKILLGKKDITSYIRTPEMSMGASTVSKIPAVRLKLVDIQRRIARDTSCVIDGRDIGSYVLPDAEFKFYLTADVGVRAKRRYLELKDKENVTLEKVKEDLIARDEQDSKRDFAPLVVPKGAFVIDTTNLGFDEVLDLVLSKISI
ncbi:MAG: (d)CMP kinase [Firmicutes bacterium]|nr:(d)CMP kinase [Bacillota bacterium]MDY5677121.1 (d)CMP kinase [Eubacteriales bacterium]